MLNVIDTGTSQATLDFPLAFGEGWSDCYVKMGGDNADTYVAPWYARQVDRCRAAGFRHVGHYWVPDANPADPDPIDTPTQQADFMVDHLHDWRSATDFMVLDNEALDGAWMFTDAGAAEFIERFKTRKGVPGRQCFMYGGWYDLAAHAWPLVLATGAMFIVADYRASSQPGMNFPDIPTIPRDRIVGHQYGGRAIGGVVTDTNAFVDHAFNYGTQGDDDMSSFAYLQNQTQGVVSTEHVVVIGGGVKDGLLDFPLERRNDFELFKRLYNLRAKTTGGAELPIVSCDDVAYKSLVATYRSTPAGGAAVIDYAALANAVNDDAAERMKD